MKSLKYNYKYKYCLGKLLAMYRKFSTWLTPSIFKLHWGTTITIHFGFRHNIEFLSCNKCKTSKESIWITKPFIDCSLICFSSLLLYIHLRLNNVLFQRSLKHTKHVYPGSRKNKICMKNRIFNVSLAQGISSFL